MFGLAVRFDLRSGTAAEFDSLATETVVLIGEREPGTIVYATHVVDGQDDARVFYEVYRDRDAFDEHERQPHVRRFLKERERYLAYPPRVEFLSLTAFKGIPGTSEA
jgi:quinol monooxygenase YgiN